MSEEKKLEDALGQLAKMLTKQEERHKVLREDMKVDFNLFTVMRKLGDEDGLHSRFLAHLLDPNAAHCCGKLFLKPFMEVVKKLNWNDAPDLDKEDFSKVKVQRERGTDQGNLDIVIESPGQWIVVVENKIWAGEQPDQLERYGAYLKDWATHNSGGKSLLVYLTLDGKEGASANGAHYAQMSYKGDVFDWLTQCLRETWAWPNINLALQQYQAVVAELTGQSLSQDNIMELSEIFVKHPELLREFDKIGAAREPARQEARKKFLLLLEAELTHRGYAIEPIPSQSGITLSKDGAPFFKNEQVKASIEFHGEHGEVWIGMPSKAFSGRQRELHEKMLKTPPENMKIWGEIPKNQKLSWDGSLLCGSGCVYTFSSRHGSVEKEKDDAFYAVMLSSDTQRKTEIIKECADRIDRWSDVVRTLWN